MALTDTSLTDAVKSYYDGFKICIVCSPKDYVGVISGMCAKFKDGESQYVPTIANSSKTESADCAKVKINIKEARNSYDKSKHKDEDVEGTIFV